MAPRGGQKDTRICSGHFVNNAKSVSQANPAYLPTLFPDVYKRRRVRGERHERWAKRSRSAAPNLTSPHPPEEPSCADVLSNTSENDGSPGTNAPLKVLEQGLLLLTEVEVDAQQLLLTCVAETQTDLVYCKDSLQLMLSATDGTPGSTQVTHVAQADKHYPKCTFIIDCTEVRTEIPMDPEAHYLYRHYKGSYTLKFLIAILPNGMVPFISKAYGSRHSDCFITRGSALLLAYRIGGFGALRQGVSCDKNHHVFVMPPFNVGGGQHSREDMETTLTIAQVRIHVERAIQRFELHNVLS
ncbi:hypothetical protein HPB48_016955 [Haemaphysalis longicornis]|uniref:DDE Tnp4 domain-containing protein n=1 Tax=Haemaphysalis longicornis TaxID=44386 RepID=A0A9J6H3D2_HAELO|nr:hypothetical protein HPB48_016955 [Haemaphysalis longicornis]